MPPSPLFLSLSLFLCARYRPKPTRFSVCPSVCLFLSDGSPSPTPRPCLYLADCRFVNLSATVYWRCGCKREESLPITYYYFNPSQRSGGRERGEWIKSFALPRPLRADRFLYPNPRAHGRLASTTPFSFFFLSTHSCVL